MSNDFHNDINRIIVHLNGAITNVRLYSITHLHVTRFIDVVYRELVQILKVKNELTLVLIDDYIIIDNKVLRSAGPHLSQFVKLLRSFGVERLTFIQNISKEELYKLITDFASTDTISLHSSTNIKLGKVEIRVDSRGNSEYNSLSEEEKEKLRKLISIRDITLEEIRDITSKIKKKEKVDVEGLDSIVKSFIGGFVHGINPIAMLASLKTADDYTFTHVVNVCILTMALAESLGFKEEKLYQIGIASVLHDSGKLFIPDNIINKPGKLTDDEREIIETHTTHGARYILGLKGIPRLAILGALEHHINFDGTGYPVLRGKWKPNIVSQMIAIADVFDALRSRRSYKEPKPLDVVVKILKEGRGTNFNPFLIDNFLKLIRN